MRAPTRDTQILIVYYSRFGVLHQLAERIAEGVQRVPRARASLLDVEDRPIEELRPGEDEAAMRTRRAVLLQQLVSADALIVGAPSYFGSMASPVKRLFEDCATTSAPPSTDRSRPWRQYLFRDKVGAAFAASATPHGGNEATLHSILTMMMHLGLVLVTPGQSPPILENESAPYGATAVSGAGGSRPPTEAEQDAARALGQQVAEVVSWLHWGRADWEAWRDEVQHTGAILPGGPAFSA